MGRSKGYDAPMVLTTVEKMLFWALSIAILMFLVLLLKLGTEFMSQPGPSSCTYDCQKMKRTQKDVDKGYYELLCTERHP